MIKNITPKEQPAQALQFTGKNADEFKKFMGGNFLKEMQNDLLLVHVGDDGYNPGIDQYLAVSDWIVRKQILNRIFEPTDIFYFLNDKQMKFFYNMNLIDTVN